MDSRLTPLFIKGFKNEYGDIEKFFLQWWCKIFADILVWNFWWEVLHWQGHYITKIDNRYWDITWEVYPKEKELDKPWYSKAIEARMESYENIWELVIYKILWTREQ